MATGLASFLPSSGTDHRIRPQPPCAPAAPRIPRASQIFAVIVSLLCLAGGLAAAVPGEPPVTGHPAAPPPAVQFAPLEFPADDRELLALDDEMQRFFAARIDDRASEATRLDQVVNAILGEQGLHFAYEKDGNYSVREAFRRRRGNCLSFSLLTVAVARAHKLTAWFCEVNTYPRWDQSGTIITEIRHLNVRVWAGSEQHEIDPLGAAEYQAPVITTKAVSDARAFSHFYNNLAVLRLAEGDAADARALFDRALADDPTAALVWANKGSALRMAGDYAGARACLERAEKEDPTEIEVLSGLARLDTQTGRMKEAAKLEKKVERYRLRNPFYLCFLARAEYAKGQFPEAEEHLRRAVSIKDDEPEFYELRILVAQALGRTADAQRWTARLQALRPAPAPKPPAPQPDHPR